MLNGDVALVRTDIVGIEVIEEVSGIFVYATVHIYHDDDKKDRNFRCLVVNNNTTSSLYITQERVVPCDIRSVEIIAKESTANSFTVHINYVDDAVNKFEALLHDNTGQSKSYIPSFM